MTTATQPMQSMLSTAIVAIFLGAGCGAAGSGTTASGEPGQTVAIDRASTAPPIHPPAAAPTAVTPEASTTATPPVWETPTDPVEAEVADCVLVDLELVRRTDEIVVGAQRQAVATVGRVKFDGERWLIEGQESGDLCG